MNRIKCLYCACVLATAILGPTGLCADGRYCGVYCVSAVLADRRVEHDLDAMVVPENMTGEYGSSASDLLRLLSAHGVESAFSSNTQWDAVLTASSPVLLHCRSVATDGFHHWILFLGYDRKTKSVSIFDPPQAEISLPVSDLVATWSGAAIFTSGNTIPPENYFPSALTFASLIASAATLLTIRKTGHAVSVFAVGLVAIMGSSLVSHQLLSVGYFNGHGKNLAAMITAADPTIRCEEVDVNRIDDFEAYDVLIDCRTPTGFESGSITSAINLPITASYPLAIEITSRLNLNPESRILVFCQSSECDYSDRIGGLLKSFGYLNVYNYRNGYVGYRQLMLNSRRL